MSLKHAATVANIFRIMNKILFLEKKRVARYEGVRFYPSEIHLLLLIAEDQSANATRMAEMLGITKGAISQTLSRLEKKGVLDKDKDPRRKNELVITFTPLGKRAVAEFLRVQRSVQRQFDQCLGGFSDREQAVIDRFLNQFAAVLDEVR